MKQALKACRMIASLGPVGNLSASGTWGSLVALPFAWILAGSGGVFLLSALSLIIGVLTVKPLIKEEKDKDPSFVVIDEFMGQLFVFSFVSESCMDPLVLIFGFLFFRLFDILKPWPASFFDKKVHTSFGVMMDDLVAAIYAMISLAFTLIISYKI